MPWQEACSDVRDTLSFDPAIHDVVPLSLISDDVVRSPAERRAAGNNGSAEVAVRLLDGSGRPMASLVVREGAPYSFTGLQPGAYQIETARLDGRPAAGGRSAPFTLASGGTVTSRASTIDTPGTVIGSVVLAGAGEAAPEGATVQLLSAAGTKVAATAAGPGGAYAFAGIPPGRYRVEFAAPERDLEAVAAPTAHFDVVEAAPPARPAAPAPVRRIGASEEEFLLAAAGHQRWQAGADARRGETGLPAERAQPPRIRRSTGAMSSVAAAPTISP
ncbi:SdrD B-like domain-containing protein [Pararoseomonas sp. SCSIO 73927]|uniref:MSCRAMM family protein n=1 Tax=Pararoseomonas sp. SCSIO 73927 TaxID=3114537 RepID=UPI0030CC5288